MQKLIAINYCTVFFQNMSDTPNQPMEIPEPGEFDISTSDEEALLNDILHQETNNETPPATSSASTTTTTSVVNSVTPTATQSQGISPLMRHATTRPTTTRPATPIPPERLRRTDLFRLRLNGSNIPVCFLCNRPRHVRSHCTRFAFKPFRRYPAMSTGGGRRCLHCNRICFTGRVCRYCCRC